MSSLSDVVEEVVKGMGGMGRRASEGFGSVFDHIRGVAHLSPEMAQMDAIVFEATIGGAVLTQPPIVKVPAGYYFDLQGVSGYISSPGVSVDNFTRLTWNIQQSGKRNVFTTDQSMGQYLDILGVQQTKWWPRTLYRFDAGGDLKLIFARASGWNVAGDNRTVGVVLYGGLVARDARTKDGQ